MSSQPANQYVKKQWVKPFVEVISSKIESGNATWGVEGNYNKSQIVITLGGQSKNANTYFNS